MQILAVTDIHSRIRKLDEMVNRFPKADLVLLTGDLTDFRGKEEAVDVARAFAAFYPKVFAISGNCDTRQTDAALIMAGFGMHGRVAVFKKVAFLGLGGSLITPFATPNEYTEAELEGILKAAAKGIPEDLPLVLVSHQPPRGTRCDRIASGAHVGSCAVRQFIETWQPAVCFCGHIHESAAMDQIGDTQIVNPGPFAGGRIGVAEIGAGSWKTAIRTLSGT